MNLTDITPVILTYNEEVNIDHTLNTLFWAECIIVMDSYSSDQTLEICRRYTPVRVFQRKFDTHCQQWNEAVSKVETPWILSLDADYRVSSALLDEIQKLEPPLFVKGYRIPFLFALKGALLNAHLLPPRIALFEKASARYVQDGHTQVLEVNGDVEPLQHPLIHDDRKPFGRWFEAQIQYAELEVEKLSKIPFLKLPLQDQLRCLILPAPIAVLFYTLLFRGLILDGIPGFKYCLQRCLAEIILSIQLLRKHLA